MTRPVVLVMAKAPVPGQVKTRLAASVGASAAARLAYVALLDTVDVCEQAFGEDRCYLALAGELVEAEHSALRRRLRRWTVLPQRGSGLGARLEHAHRDVHEAAGEPVVQIGMDTPHLAPADLRTVGATVARERTPVLGPAYDGGWWVLASGRADQVRGLSRVPMSVPGTGRATLDLLRAAGHDVVLAPVVRDVDDASDAQAAAAQAPGTRFARIWRSLAGDTVAGRSGVGHPSPAAGEERPVMS